MKIQLLDAEELKSLEGLDDAALLKLVRDGLKEFRASGKAEAEDDAEDPPASTGGAGHGGPATATLETQRSRSGNVNPGGAATDAALQATLDEARRLHEAQLRSDEHATEVEKLIPNYRRL